MSEIKLQVGKTYRSRVGEEVKIVRTSDSELWPFVGDNGKSYSKSGNHWYSELPDDLIEEVTVSDASQKRNKTEQVKLQVGKTYRNRKGEEVKIVEKGRSGKFPYKDNNGRRYTENGRFAYYAGETPDDLIEEVPSEPTRHTFDIPDGVKKVTVEQVGNRIVVEMALEEGKGPKPGDVMINRFGSVYIFKSVVSSDVHKCYCYAWAGEGGRLTVGSLRFCGRPATPEEAQPLFDALKKAGKRWNAETMQVEEITEKEKIENFLESFADGAIWSREQLRWLMESYLKYREGE